MTRLSARDAALARVAELEAKLAAAEAEINQLTANETHLCKKLDEALAWGEDDKPIPEDEAIKAARPMRTGKHEIWGEAQRMISAKRSKYALVDLVNWLMAERDEARARYSAACSNEMKATTLVEDGRALRHRLATLEKLAGELMLASKTLIESGEDLEARLQGSKSDKLYPNERWAVICSALALDKIVDELTAFLASDSAAGLTDRQ